MALIKNWKVVSNKEAVKNQKTKTKTKTNKKKINYIHKPCYYIEEWTYHLYDGIVLNEVNWKCKIEWTCRYKSKRWEKHIGYAKIEDISWDKT